MDSHSSPIHKTIVARSLSLPLESNPIVAKIATELNKLRSLEESSSSSPSESIIIGLSGVATLYKCVAEYLSLPMTQQALSLSKHDKALTQLFHGSSRLLEVCSGAREIAMQMREASREFLKDPRSVSRYFCSRKKAVKAAKKLMVAVRVMGHDTDTLLDQDHGQRVSVLINVLRCVSIISVTILESVVKFFGVLLSKSKGSFDKLGLIGRVMGLKGKSMCEESENELESVDVALRVLSADVDNDVEGLRVARKRLVALEGRVEGIVKGLEGLVGEVTRTRGSLMEILLA